MAARNLDVTRKMAFRRGPDATLDDIRARAAAGLPLDHNAVRDSGLFDRARRHFGTWYSALAAAGLAPAGARRSAPKRKRERLSAALLRSGLSVREIERRTGVDRQTIRLRRRLLGLSEPRRPLRPRRNWRTRLGRLLGVLPDGEIARRANVKTQTVTQTRKKLGIPRATRQRVIRRRRPGA